MITAENQIRKNDMQDASRSVSTNNQQIKSSPINQIDKKSKSKRRTRIPFNIVEDNLLLQLVDQYGIDKKKNWYLIAEHLEGRTARQCRERYQLYLSEGVKKKVKWTKEEDDILLSKYSILGPKWKEIEKYLQGRNSYSIKNRYISLSKKINKKMIFNSNQQFIIMKSNDSLSEISKNDEISDVFGNSYLESNLNEYQFLYQDINNEDFEPFSNHKENDEYFRFINESYF